MEGLRSRAGHARSSETTFGTDKVAISLDSRAPGLAEATRARTYDRLHDIVKEVDSARVLVGFHFRNSDLQGSNLGRKVGDYVSRHYFQPLRCRDREEGSPFACAVSVSEARVPATR